jgi:hypothetical protein
MMGKEKEEVGFCGIVDFTRMQAMRRNPTNESVGYI